MNGRLSFIAIGSLLIVLLLSTGAVAAPAAGFGLGRHVIAAGGGRASSDGYVLDGTFGQPAAGGGLGNASYQLGTGYWGDTAPPASTPEYNIFLPLVVRES